MLGFLGKAERNLLFKPKTRPNNDLTSQSFSPKNVGIQATKRKSLYFCRINPKNNPKMDDNRLIRFDWAAKRMLRDKANFGVLEGLVTVLLNEPIHIVELLESESNQDDPQDKFNRVDIKAKNSKGEIIIVEIQQTRELYYLERILYGVARTITEHIELGKEYDHVKKVYSINILYFDLGKGKDYLYHGTTTFRGVHTNDILEITTKDENALRMRTPEEIFPEYFLIRVNEFNAVAKTPLEEWLDYLKNAHIKEDTTAPGLQEARKKLQYLKMDSEERKAYQRQMENYMYQDSVFAAAHLDGWTEGKAQGVAAGLEEGMAKGRAEGMAKGRAEGRAEGMAKGRAEANLETARKLKALGLDFEVIAKGTGLTVEEISKL